MKNNCRQSPLAFNKPFTSNLSLRSHVLAGEKKGQGHGYMGAKNEVVELKIRHSRSDQRRAVNPFWHLIRRTLREGGLEGVLCFGHF